MRRLALFAVAPVALAATLVSPALALPPAGLAEPAKETCTGCHAESNASKLRQPVELLRKDVHAQANLGCTSCHGGDPTAAQAAAAHGKAFVVGTSMDAAVAMCSKCHQAPAEGYAKGPHHLAKGAARRPSCATCHGSHGIQTASLALIAEPLCSSCHGITQARRIQKALDETAESMISLDRDLAKAGNYGAQRTKLKELRSQLRGTTHSLDLINITRQAAVALATVDDIRDKTMPHKAARDWGELLQTVAVASSALMILLAAVVAARWVWARRTHAPILGKLTKNVAPWLGGIAAVLVIGGALAGWKTYNYINHDPKFCLSCHTMNTAFDLWKESGHKNVDCHACHVPSLSSNLHQIWVYTTRRPDTVIKHAEIDRAVCEKCHASGKPPAQKNKIVETAGHKVHAGKARIDCVQCHGESVHKFRPPKEVCATCHKQITMTAAGTMAEMHCLQCHNFLAVPADPKKASMKPDRVLCLDCHQKRQIGVETFPTGKAPMKWECGKCHKPHEKMAIGNAECVKCHDTINEGLHKVSAHAKDCQSCHQPHSWTSGSQSCRTCHAGIDPAIHHPEGKKACADCHGAWDDSWVKLPPKKTAGKGPRK